MKILDLSFNLLTSLPESLKKLIELTDIWLEENPLLTDLSMLQSLPKLSVYRFGMYLPRRYWTKLSEWKAEWLLDENNAKIRSRLIQQVGYD